MVILFVVNMHGGFEAAQPIATAKKINLGGWISSPESPIESGISYVICPVIAGFEYTKSLFDKFDEVLFLKDHDNYVVRMQQSELEYSLTPIYRTPRHESRMMFFGCSHTFGDGHASIKTTYPDILSNLIGVEYANHGLSGKSNYDIEDLMNQYQFSSNQIIVVQFTDMYRIRYMVKDTVVSQSIHSMNSSANNKILLNEDNLFFNFQQLTTRVINRLKEGNSKFLITFTYHYSNEYDLKCLEHLLQYEEFSSHAGTAVDTASDGTHYGINSHKLWAEKLFNKWTELYGKE